MHQLLDSPNWPLYAFGLLLFVPAFCIFQRRYLSPLRHIPGPFLGSFSPLYKLLSTYSTRTNYDHIDLHRKYGPVVRTANNEASVSGADAARQVMTPGKGFHKTEFYTVFPPSNPPDIFTEIDEGKHAIKKRAAGVAFSLQTMKQSQPLVNQMIQRLFTALDRFADSPDKSFELGDWLHYFAFDTLGMIAFTRDFGFIEAGYDLQGAIQTIKKTQRVAGMVAQIPAVFRINEKLNLVRPPTIMIAEKAISYVQSRMPFSAQQEDPKTDILGHLIQRHLADSKRLSADDVTAISIASMFAGSDSTASTMQSFFYFILRHPKVYARIVSEIMQAAHAGQLSEPATFDEAQQLEYFQAAFMESMRLRPAVGLSMSRCVPAGGLTVDGKYIPPGTTVTLNAWVVHRDLTVFGPDPDEYRPERWLEDSERAKFMERHMFQFGGGSHVCIGRHLSLVEMHKLIPSLLRRYDVSLASLEHEHKEEALFFVVQSGLVVTLRKRTST